MNLSLGNLNRRT